MGLFDNWPYTNFHELNLQWILEMLQKIDKTMDEFVAINALKYADPIQWNITKQYEKNTIVIDPLSGTAYISVQPVPSGVNITNTDYWTIVFDLGSFIVRAAQNFTNHYETETTLTATFPSNVGNWLVWGDVLYEVISPIIAGDQYVVNSNIRHITMEEVINALEQAIDAVNTKVGDLNDLNTRNRTSIVNSINSITSNFYTPKMFGAAGDGVTDDTQALQDCFDAMRDNHIRVVGDTNATYLISDVVTIHNQFFYPPNIDMQNASIKYANDLAELQISGHAQGGTIRNLHVDCNGHTGNGLVINDCMHGIYENIFIENVVSTGVVINVGYEIMMSHLHVVAAPAQSINAAMLEMNTSDSMFYDLVSVNCHIGITKTGNHNIFNNVHCWIAGTAQSGTINNSTMINVTGNYCTFNNIAIDTMQSGFMLDSEYIVNINNVTTFADPSVLGGIIPAIINAANNKATRSICIDKVCGYGISYQFCSVSFWGRASNIQLVGYTDVTAENIVGSMSIDFGTNTPIFQTYTLNNGCCHLNGNIQVDNAVAGSDIVLFTVSDNGLPVQVGIYNVGVATSAYAVQDVTSGYFNNTTGEFTIHIPLGYSGTVFFSYDLYYDCVNGSFLS